MTDFATVSETTKFETDMETLNYKKWLTRFPGKQLKIFAKLLYYNGDSLSEKDVVYFVQQGMDVNGFTKEFYTDSGGKTTALNAACEYRYVHLIDALLKHGADVNLTDERGWSPLDNLLWGHSADSPGDYDTVEECVRIMAQYPLVRSILRETREEVCEEYIGESGYMREFLRGCVVEKMRGRLVNIL